MMSQGDQNALGCQLCPPLRVVPALTTNASHGIHAINDEKLDRTAHRSFLRLREIHARDSVDHRSNAEKRTFTRAIGSLAAVSLHFAKHGQERVRIKIQNDWMRGLTSGLRTGCRFSGGRGMKDRGFSQEGMRSWIIDHSSRSCLGRRALKATWVTPLIDAIHLWSRGGTGCWSGPGAA